MDLLNYVYGERCDIRCLRFCGECIYNAKDVARFLGENRIRVRNGLKVGDEVYISKFKMYKFFIKSRKPKADFFSVEKCRRILESFDSLTEYRKFTLGLLS